jgi:hypothetical protein
LGSSRNKRFDVEAFLASWPQASAYRQEMIIRIEQFPYRAVCGCLQQKHRSIHLDCHGGLDP